MAARTWLLGVVALSVLPGVARGADQAILGGKLQMNDPGPGGAPSRRKLLVEGRERDSTNTMVGDPTAEGAVLTVFVGAVQETYVLRQGVDPATGRSHWRGGGGQFTYRDASGANGAVTSAQLKRSPGGTFRIKAVADAGHGAMELRPPAALLQACLRLEIVGGDSYHVVFPIPPDSTIARNDAGTFVVKRPLIEGLCAPAPVSTTTTGFASTSPSTTSTSTTSTTSTTLRCDATVRDAGCPELQRPEIMAVEGRTVWLDGERLMESSVPIGEHAAVFSCPDAEAVVPRGDPAVVEWGASRIRMPLPGGVDSRCTVEVRVGAASTTAMPLRVYAVTEFSLPGFPIVLDRGPDGTVWIGAEFSAALFRLAPGASTIETLAIPTPPGFFRSRLQLSPGPPVPDVGVEFSAFVERVVAAPDGSVWLTQGGWGFYTYESGAPYHNGSRVVRYSPDIGDWRCYALPGQSAEAIGLALTADGTILVAAAGEDAILHMDAAALDAAGLNDCASALAAGECGAGQTPAIDACWERRRLPADTWHYPTHVHADPATGDWWTVGAESNQVLRYSPSTDTWTQWSLPGTERQPPWWWPWDGAQPWWFALGGDGRVRTASFVAASLDELDPATGSWRRRPAPTASTTDWSFVYWHATDDDGRLWVSGAFGAADDLEARPLGYWLDGQDDPVLLPPLDDEPPHAQNGISGFWISGDARTVYGARFTAGRVVRLEQIP